MTDIMKIRYHLVNEPFDYTSWKTGKLAYDMEPSIKALGTDNG